MSTSPSNIEGRRLQASSVAPKFDYSGGGTYSFGDSRSQFTVSPDGGSFGVAGLYTVSFPANSICDPNLSSYGVDQWNAPCVTLTRPITISATLRLTSAGLNVDFSPALRFAPDKQVTIGTDLFSPIIRANRDFFSAHPETLRPLAMYYAPFLGADRVADYLTDYSLVTHVNLTTGRVWRRIKHFSGYMNTSGQACDPGAGDPDCIWVDDGRDQPQ